MNVLFTYLLTFVIEIFFQYYIILHEREITTKYWLKKKKERTVCNPD